MASSPSSNDHLSADYRLSLPRLLGFATPGFCVGALAIALGVYLPRFYAGHIGLGLAAVGGVFGAIRLGDTILDPFIGVAMDRTRTRFGRYRLWLLLGAPVLALGVYMLFEPPAHVPVAYLFGWLLVYYVGTSLITLSHASWASVIASKYHERSRVFGAIQFVGILGACAALVLPIVLARKDGSSGAHDVAAMGWLVVVSIPVGVLLALILTPERLVAETSTERYTLKDYGEMILRPDMLRIIAADFCLALGPGWMAALYLFYFHDARGFSIKDASAELLIYVFAGVVGAPSLSWLATRMGKHRTLMVASTSYSLGLIVLAFAPKGAFVIAGIMMFVLGFMAAGFPLLDRAMVADVGDAVRLEKGKSRIGLLYAMITTSQKVATALAITFSYTALSLIGYQAKEGVANTPQAILGMQLVYIIGPIFFVMLGGACYIGYKLDAKRHAQIREQLAQMDATVEAPVLQSLVEENAAAPLPSAP
ncbi:MAG TPA: MFS transporter [Caulobacteraceae bacterium]|nr:MFS transporter [Caulobacteraceae bacterium]